MHQVLSITGSSPVNEGSNASFTITSDQAITNNSMMVKYKTTQSGNFITSVPSTEDMTTQEMKTFSSSSPYSTTINVGTTDDMVDEANGSVTLALVAIR